MPRRSDKVRIVATAVLLGALLAGCSDIYYDRREGVTFAANDATATAQATQIINPWPTASADRSHTSSGSVVAGAITRYRTCQVVQPRPTTTQGTYNTTALPAQPGCEPPPASAAPSK
jgi:hypothetical protein